MSPQRVAEKLYADVSVRASEAMFQSSCVRSYESHSQSTHRWKNSERQRRHLITDGSDYAFGRSCVLAHETQINIRG